MFQKYLFFLICFGAIIHTDSTAQSDETRLLSDLQYQVKLANSNKPENVVGAFQNLYEYKTSKRTDSLLLEGLDLITSYHIANNNYYDAIHWYFFAIDSLCSNSIGKCIKMRREIADIFTQVEDYKNARNYYKQNLTVLEKNNRHKAAALECSNIASLYKFENKNDSIESYLNRALEHSKKTGKAFFIVHTYNDLGIYYSEVKNYKLAELNYKKGLEILKNKTDSKSEQQRALIKGNLGSLYLKMGMIDKGVSFLLEDIKQNKNSSEPSIAIYASIELADYYQKEKHYQTAIETLLNCLNFTKNQNDEIYVLVYNNLFLNYLAVNNSQKAAFYFNKYKQLKQEIDGQKNQIKRNIEKSLVSTILKAQLNDQKKSVLLKEKENKILEKENKLNRYISIIIVWSVLIIVFFLIFYFRKRISMLRITKQLAEKNLLLEKTEKEKLDVELHYKNKDLTDFAIDLARKQEILKEIKDKLTELKNAGIENEKSLNLVKELLFYTNNNMLVDDNLKEFQNNIEEVNYKFFDVMQERFPDLTPLDIQVCGLIRLGLSNKEIATMRNVTYKAVKMSRYRIRKKLNLEEDEDMVQFLKSI